jgi:hypothetical protein
VLDQGADEARAPAVERPQPAPDALTPAGVMSLQRAAGNAAIAQMLSAPGPVLTRWAYKAVTDHKQRLDRNDKWGEGTLHHHISQYRLNMLGEQVLLGRKSRDGEIRRGVQQFENVVDAAIEFLLVTALKVQGVGPGGDIKKKLANLPMNLHYGPALVANNPGIDFDPSTVPGSDGARVIAPASAALRLLDGEISKIGALGKNEVLEADTWTAMAKHLGVALQAYMDTKDIFEENSDQWMEGAGSAWHKKGELKLQNGRHARSLFGRPTPETGLGNGVQVQVTKQFQLSNNRAPANVVIGAREKAITHFCNRHTYAHFDKTQVKAVNIFWPAGTDRTAIVAHLRRAIDAAWTHISGKLDASMEEYQLTDRLLAEVGGAGLKRTDQGMYYRIFIPSDPLLPTGADPELEIDMLAPTGSGYDAYEGNVLKELFG